MRKPSTFRLLFGTIDALDELVAEMPVYEKTQPPLGIKRPWNRTRVIEVAVASFLENIKAAKKKR